MSNKAIGAGNQQATRQNFARAKIKRGASETTRQTPNTKSEIIAYLNGAIHDASLNKGKRIRIAQKDKRWLKILQLFLKRINCNGWIYREGKNRNVFILETLCKDLDFKFNPSRLKNRKEKIFYLKGFFDAEGGIPRDGKKFYIQLVQKDLGKMMKIKTLLNFLNIKSGKIHNPSERIDPDYWRIYISAEHHKKFAKIIGSFHPSKAKIFRVRMKI